MGETLGFKAQRATRRHKCSWCGEWILMGTTYKRWCWVDSHDPLTIKMHPECYARMQQDDACEGFELYANKRGTA